MSIFPDLGGLQGRKARERGGGGSEMLAVLR